MRTLICPISPERINHSVVRLTGGMMALLIALYAMTGNPLFLVVAAGDYSIRAWTTLPYSPFSWLAAQLLTWLNLPSTTINKAPKIFAARVGFLFALTAALLAFVNPISALVVALILMGFALLESLIDLCVGCLVYTYAVYPFFGARQ